MDNTGSEKGNDINKNIEPVNDNMNNKTHENNNLPINTNVDKDKVLGDNKVINKQKVEELNKEMDVLTEQSDKDIQQNIDLLESVSLSEILKNNVKNMFSFIPSIQTLGLKICFQKIKKHKLQILYKIKIMFLYWL